MHSLRLEQIFGLAKVGNLFSGRQLRRQQAKNTGITYVDATATVPNILLSLKASLPLGQARVTLLAVEGQLDRGTYEAFIAAVVDLYKHGRSCLLLDLRRTTCIELSGLFALYSIARLYSGGSLLDPEVGWTELRAVAEQIIPALGQRVKLLAPPPDIAKSIQNASFWQFLEIYDDLDIAIAAFQR